MVPLDQMQLPPPPPGYHHAHYEGAPKKGKISKEYSAGAPVERHASGFGQAHDQPVNGGNEAA